MMNLVPFAIAAAAAKKSRGSRGIDLSDGDAIFLCILIGIPIAVLLVGIFIASPIFSIVGGAKLLSAETQAMKESALSLIEEGLFGILVSYVVGFISIPMSISSYFRPYPPRKDYWGCYNKEEEQYKKELKAFWLKTQIPIIFVTLAVIIAIIAATTWAIQCLDGSPKTTAIVVIVLASLALATNVATVVTKIALD